MKFRPSTSSEVPLALQHLVAFNVWKIQVRRKGSPTTEYQVQTFDQTVLAPAVCILLGPRIVLTLESSASSIHVYLTGMPKWPRWSLAGSEQATRMTVWQISGTMAS
jgi:hypothetical protein